MTQSILPIAERYLYCQRMRKSAATKWVSTSLGWTPVEDEALSMDETPPEVAAVINRLNTADGTNLFDVIADPAAGDMMRQYLVAKLYADKYPEIYGSQAAAMERQISTLAPAWELFGKQIKEKANGAMRYSPDLTRHGIYKTFDETFLQLYNNSHPDKKLTLEQLDPRLKRLDFSRYAPGIVTAGAVPLVLGALTGNLGGGALLGALLAGGMGYYGYKRIQPNGWKATFLDKPFQTEDIGMTDTEYAEYQKKQQQKNAPKPSGNGTNPATGGPAAPKKHGTTPISPPPPEEEGPVELESLT